MVVISDTTEVINALRNKYDDKGFSYAFLEQVSDGTGANCNHWADALAVQLWESRGLEIIGFEVKVSRQDWIKELKQPAKADAIAKYCHQWYLVVGDEDIIQFGELPAKWGLMVPHTKTTLKIVKPAVRTENPIPVDMSFLCAILRKATQQLFKGKDAEYYRGHADGFKEGKKELDYLRETKNEKLAVLEDMIKKFEDASGVKINDYWKPSEKIGEAVRFVLDKKYISELKDLERLKETALNIVDNIDIELKKHNQKTSELMKGHDV